MTSFISRIDDELLNEALVSLVKHNSKQIQAKAITTGKASLLDDETTAVMLQIQLIKSIKKPVSRPVRVKIPHSIFSPEALDHSVCLFCKTEDKYNIEEYLKQHPILGLSKVLSISDVIKLYKSFKDKRELRADFSHFLCDSNIVPQLYNALGTTFQGINDLPIPIEFKETAQLRDAAMKALSSTYLHLKGQTISFRIAFTNMPTVEIAENIKSGLEFCVEKIQGSWPNVHSIHVKTLESPSMPIYGSLANEALKVLKETAKALNAKKEQEIKLKSSENKKSSSKELQKDLPVKLDTKSSFKESIKYNSITSRGSTKKVSKSEVVLEPEKSKKRMRDDNGSTSTSSKSVDSTKKPKQK